MLATPEDVEKALRRELTDSEDEWIDSLLDEAADLVNGYLSPFEIPTPTPGPITRVVAALVASVLNRPQEILPDTQSLSTGSYSVQFAAGTTSLGPYFTSALKERLRPFRQSCVVVELSSERY